MTLSRAFRSPTLFGALFVLLAGACTPRAEEGVPILPPLTISTPSVDGEVTVTGEAEPEALVLGVNEDRGQGSITTSALDGTYVLVLPGAVGETIVLWQRVGTSDSLGRSGVVPGP